MSLKFIFVLSFIGTLISAVRLGYNWENFRDRPTYEFFMTFLFIAVLIASVASLGW